MRLSHRKRASAAVSLQMTSMIDVTFLLLIFFMITSSFYKTERELDPQLKVNRQAPTSRTSRTEPIIVELVPGERGYVMRLGGRDFTSIAELVAVLRQLPASGDGAFVRVPPEAPFELAAQAIQACKQAGLTPVSYVPKN